MMRGCRQYRITNKLRQLLFCLLLLLVVALPSQASAAPMVTMSVVDADVRDVLTGLATIGKVNVVIDDSVSG